ncbi:MAG TPA: hypothetical protein VHS30_30365 [Streptosporangiaceae bacterium]|jgi:hypothetical protein|nr:hypothetical protein [Streptosporangiaceae bacterium]
MLAACEAMLMIFPPPASIMARPTCWGHDHHSGAVDEHVHVAEFSED